MIRSGGKRELVFFIIIFAVFYILTASVVPYLGIRPSFDVLTDKGTVMNTVRPDIMLALVICCAIVASGKRTVVLGIIFGFLVDVTCSVPMISSLCYCLCAMYAGKLSHIFFGRGVVNAVLVSFPLLLMRSIISTFYLLGTWHNISFRDIITGAVIPEYVYNIVTVAIVWGVLALLMKVFRIEKTV